MVRASDERSMTIAHLPDGRWVDVNDSFVRMMEFTREEAVGHTSLELGMFPEPVERGRILRDLPGQGSIRDVELTVRTKSGKLITVLSTNEKISLNGQDHAVSTLVDITEQDAHIDVPHPQKMN